MSAAPVEGKVWGSLTGFGSGGVTATLVIWLLGVLVWHQPSDAMHAGQAVGAVPSPVSLFIGAVITGGGVFAGGWLAKHTPRPVDLAAGPVIVKTDATTAPIDGPALKAVIDDLRATLVKPVKITLNGQTVATTRLHADTSAPDAALAQVRDNIEGRQMTEAPADTATEV